MSREMRHMLYNTILVFWALTIFPLKAFSQSSNLLTLDECYQKARDNYPLLQQLDLIKRTADYSLENISKGIIPQVNIYGQASYQSNVTAFPIEIPNVIIQTLAKDQYKITGEIIQPLTDFGIINQQKAIAEAKAKIESRNLETELYKIKERITQLYFGVLLVDGQLTQIELLKKDVQIGLAKANAGIANGVTLKIAADQLQAELLTTDQRAVELQANRSAFLEMLSLFIGEDLAPTIELASPPIQTLNATINRPELATFAAQREVFSLQSELINKKNNPHLNAFFQGGYGRPGLNFLSSEFELFYVTGVRLNWNISNFYTSKKEKEILKLNQNSVQILEETFLLNTTIALAQHNQEVQKYLTLLDTDSEIIALREKVKSTANSQLEFGSITANDYLTYINAEDKARQNRIYHSIQLLMTQYTYLLTSGN